MKKIKVLDYAAAAILIFGLWLNGRHDSMISWVLIALGAVLWMAVIFARKKGRREEL